LDRTLLKTGAPLRHLAISAVALLITVIGVTPATVIGITLSAMTGTSRPTLTSLAHADTENDPGSAAEKAPLVPLATARVNDKGNELQRNGKFEEAAQVYREEALKRPENGILQRNLAGALSRSGQLEEGLAAYSQAVRFADTRQEKAAALFDLGNALVLAGQAEQAMQTWASAMMLAPEDMDIKHNFEYLLKQQQEQQQEQNDDQDEGEQGEQEQDQQEQPDQNQDDQDQESQDQEQKQEQSEQEQQEQDQANPDESQQPEPSEENEQMSEEDAKRLLDAMLEEEKELQAERNRQAQIRDPNVEKDW
jgi:Ca-activated chloride channel homolog